MGISRIVVTRSIAELAAEADEEIERDTPNDEASVERWGELLRAQLAEQFLNAHIQILTVRAKDAGFDVAVEADSGEEERSAREAVRRISERLDASGDWVVPEVGG